MVMTVNTVNKNNMKLSKLSWAAIAAAGLLSLTQSTRAEEKAEAPAAPAARRAGGRMSAENQLKELTEKLKLNADQEAKIKVVLEDRIKGMQGARDLSPEERKAKGVALREETTKKMKEILTADQYKQYEELQKQMNAARRNNGTNAPAPASTEEGAKKKKKKAE